MKSTATAALLLAVLTACAVSEGTAQLRRHGITATLPGAEPFDPALDRALGAAWEARPADYVPRTQHLRADGTPLFANRLLLESSPYLRQHAHNPVDWYPWGDEAFELARALGRPVLLSIGYSTCHWCHVMEEESFDDLEIAEYLNANYVAVKVDRELRPDLDAIYMSAVQLFTQGRGGWPMTLWLTPDRQPYSGGSYFPARDGDRGVAVGLLTLLERLKAAYDVQPERVVEVAGLVVDEIRAHLTPPAAGAAVADDGPLRRAAAIYRAEFDPAFGGLRGTQKFPASLPLRFLLREQRRTGDLELLGMVTTTLERMAAGGMHDQIGGGFHRYATDPQWLVPHFEKMLYDNALLALAYLEAYQVTGREDFAAVVGSILRYVEREMTAPGGGFYSATDADSLAPGGQREEGWFFTWTPAEIEAAVGADAARLVKPYFGVTAAGNFDGRTVLHRPRGDVELARELGVPPAVLQRRLGEARERLYAARARRPAPLRDEKVLTAWNGLMISAFARAALVLHVPAYAERAAGAADFLLTRARDGERLVRSVVGLTGEQAGYLDDYAFLIGGLLDLFEASGDTRWLQSALALDGVLEADFEDRTGGGFFRTPAGADPLLAREKPHYDSAEPSGNAAQLLNLVRLHDFTGDDRFRVRAERALGAFAATLNRAPAAAAEMLLALDYRLDTPKEVIIVAPGERGEADPFLERLAATFLPNRVLTVAVEGPHLEEQAQLVPLLAGKYARGGQATAYVCEKRVCDLPTTDPAQFAEQIRRTAR